MFNKLTTNWKISGSRFGFSDRVDSLDKKNHSTLSVFTQVNKWVPGKSTAVVMNETQGTKRTNLRGMRISHQV